MKPYVFRFSILCTLCLLLAVVSACPDSFASDKTTDKSPQVVHACDLLSRSEAEAMIGGSVPEPRLRHKESEASEHWMSSCTYYSESRGYGIDFLIKPNGYHVSGAEAIALHEADLKKSLKDGFHFEKISGIGEGAGWDDRSKQLTVFKGPYMLIVTSTGAEIMGTNALELAEGVAGTVLGRLPEKN
jgi:hypothetical protein